MISATLSDRTLGQAQDGRVPLVPGPLWVLLAPWSVVFVSIKQNEAVGTMGWELRFGQRGQPVGKEQIISYRNFLQKQFLIEEKRIFFSCKHI